MFGTIMTGLMSAVGTIVIKVASKEVLTKLILWGAEKLVKSTKTSHDDEFYAIIKEAVDKHK